MASNFFLSNFRKIKLYLIVVLFCNISCINNKEQQKNKDEHNLYLNPTFSVTKENKKKKYKQVKFLTNFFKTKWNYNEYKNMLFKNERKNLKDPFTNLKFRLEKQYENFKPTLLFLTDVSKKQSIAKVAFQKNAGYGFSSLGLIYNFMIIKAKGNYKITSVFSYNTRNFQKEKFENIDYIHPAGFVLNINKVNKMNAFNKKIANYFHVNPVSFNYYICKDYNQIMRLRGYDLIEGMFRENSYNSIANHYFKRIFNGRLSEYSPHEVVHLYQKEYFHYTNPIIIEGIATYLGGAPPLTFNEYMIIFKKHSDSHQIDFYKELFLDQNYTVNDMVSLKYAIGALFCDLAVKKHGKEGLYDLLESGKSNRDLLLTLEDLFGINKSNFNNFIRENIKDYE